MVLHTLLAGHADSLSDAGQFLHLANVYLDLGDAYTDENKRRESYEQGAKVAQRALALEPSNAEAHYLYAANVGSAAQLQGMMASALTVNEIKSHVKRALELNPDYAPALHMMGMMYEELPWFLGGDGEAALTHVQHAVTVDPQYTHARLDLAKLYLKRRNASAARQELQTIMSGSPRPGTNDQRYRQEARQLLASLPTK
jgi:tetratricopeptide (TPR) repeat protein